MTTIDGIILIALGAGATIGFMKGFIRQLASILGLTVGLLTAKALYTSLAVKPCSTMIDSMTVVQILAFIITWIAVPLVFTLMTSVLTKTMEAVPLSWLSHSFGARLGALKHPLLVSLVVCVIQFTDTDSQSTSQVKKEESLLYYPMERFAGIFFLAAKGVT